MTRTAAETAAADARHAVNYKTHTHPELATAERAALRRVIDASDAGLDFTGFAADVRAIRIEKARRAAWTV